jgi:plastocyanin
MRPLALALTIGVLAIAGCGGDDDEPEDGSAQVSREATGRTAVDMNDRLTFEPRKIEVSVGAKLTWTNAGKIAHTVTADRSKAADPSLVSIPAGTKEWDSGLVNEAESYSRTFEKPGTYRYICIPHEGVGMVGTVVVE